MNNDKGAGVRIPPPVIFIGFMLVGLALESLLAINVRVPIQLGFFGLGLSVIGLAVLIYLAIQFKHAKTHIEPWKPTSNIITTGLYAYSRNPIYLAFCTMPIGLGLFFSHMGLLVSVLPSCISIYYLAIRPEEVYLTKKFGDDYLNYQQKVRRWI